MQFVVPRRNPRRLAAETLALSFVLLVSLAVASTVRATPAPLEAGISPGFQPEASRLFSPTGMPTLTGGIRPRRGRVGALFHRSITVEPEHADLR